MAQSFDIPLTGSRGLGKIVFFSGLDLPAVVTPSLFGEPLLTVQPFYFLERMECVARVRFESAQDMPPAKSSKHFERILEYIIDNYLFSYSLNHPESKLTTKIHEMIYWRDDPNYHYWEYDWRLVKALTLDYLNDTSIKSCRDKQHPGKDYWQNYCLFKSYADHHYGQYTAALRKAMASIVTVKTKNHPSLGTGTKKLPILNTRSKPLTFSQAEMFEVIRPTEDTRGKSSYVVNRGYESPTNFELPMETLTTRDIHSPSLLAYYFSALRDHSAVSQFKNFYNVLEYFFDDAPRLLSVKPKREREQLQCVIRCMVTERHLREAISQHGELYLSKLGSALLTSSGQSIPKLDPSKGDLIAGYSDRLYDIRNACLHSKRTRSGRVEARIEPTTDDEEIVSTEIPLLQYLAATCIKHEERFTTA